MTIPENNRVRFTRANSFWHIGITMLTSRSIRNKQRRQRGTAAAEFAITLPLFMTLLFGSIDFGRVGYYSIALANAVGEASRFAATTRVTVRNRAGWEEEIDERIEQEMSEMDGFSPALLTSNIETDVLPDGDLRVAIRARYSFTTIVDWPGLPSMIPISRTFHYVQYQ